MTGIRSGSPLCSAAAGARLVGSDARLRALVGCAWLGYFFVVPEGLAAPPTPRLLAAVPAPWAC